ncbi:ABC transporter permease [Rufibacter sediminis]|uniref:ABC transporter permease n=1 Tax=Rufibacter sediminis TaxID=2762756 RepID=A0ABR6VNC5_9BACT|nr:ABC transporter permease [Rufibacter sediminis]MBC3538645.1 ABC transporter permease [Rufibacter sediminis]
MIKNYLKIAWRNLLRHKAYSAINIIGLATGISACLLIFLYVRHELTYEQEFAHAENIYRVTSRMTFQEQDDKLALTPKPLADYIRRGMPEVKHVARISTVGKQTLWVDQQPFLEEHLFFADSTFFQVIPFPFLAGDPVTALQAPGTIVLSDELARKFYGGVEQALGKSLQFSHNRYTVTGVFKDTNHSHIRANAFLSMVTRDAAERSGKDAAEAAESVNHWLYFGYYTYFTLHNPASLPVFEQKLADLVTRYAVPWMQENQISASMKLFVQPISQIHLSNEFGSDLSAAGNRSYVYIFTVVAVFILLIGCINYMNLATARSAKRAREVGLRKVVGAYRRQIIGQFLGESILITLLALLLALAMTEVSLPVFNQLTRKEFTLSSFYSPEFALLILLILLFVSLVAGSYPAFFLSGFNPIDVLKADKNPRGSNAWLRQFLVVVQFTISLVLIIGTAVVYSQLQFLKSKNLGFTKEQILVLDLPKADSLLIKQLPVFTQKLVQHPNVLQVATAGNIPGEKLNQLRMIVEEKDGTEKDRAMNVMFVSYGFLELMGIQTKEGRMFQKDLLSDRKGAVMINEAGAKWLGWENAIGKHVQVMDYDARVIGVVKNFNFESLHHAVKPLMLVPIQASNGYLVAKVRPQNLENTLAFLEQQWKAFAPRHPLDYFFLDDNFNQQYQAEEKMLTVFGYFAALTILIACLGLFGLASFTAEQRTKEIGIRKVLGSTVLEIVLLLSKDFALLVLLAILIASPVAWYGMKNWLQDFAYQVNLSPWLFFTAGLVSLLIAITTVGVQAARAALLDPVKSLRRE